MLCLIIHRVHKMFDWFAGNGFHCSSALCLFQYNFGDYWDMHGIVTKLDFFYSMWPIILGCFFPTITMGISTFHFTTSMIQGGNFSKFSINSYGTFLWKIFVIIDVTMAYINISILCVFFSQLKNGNNKNQFWALCRKIHPGPGTCVPGSARCACLMSYFCVWTW